MFHIILLRRLKNEDTEECGNNLYNQQINLHYIVTQN